MIQEGSFRNCYISTKSGQNQTLTNQSCQKENQRRNKPQRQFLEAEQQKNKAGNASLPFRPAFFVSLFFLFKGSRFEVRTNIS